MKMAIRLANALPGLQVAIILLIYFMGAVFSYYYSYAYRPDSLLAGTALSIFLGIAVISHRH